MGILHLPSSEGVDDSEKNHKAAKSKLCNVDARSLVSALWDVAGSDMRDDDAESGVERKAPLQTFA